MRETGMSTAASFSLLEASWQPTSSHRRAAARVGSGARPRSRRLKELMAHDRRHPPTAGAAVHMTWTS
jgi:hypothetical protein